ncbi:uncharacterized protein LOC106163418 [Lingula anatina]|uniref:Uncharacterized protein LOC106163418 n=1 Tax=Lingula anatina TaxID=7574 RepID=A0A1S3IDX2_LINAN|nr:uncharacterized protein LOC106163418 [Lingula anatina]|eukprot:XP_013396455.1 uncharacterized protein LOC106163418 [Lingula anatina]
MHIRGYTCFMITFLCTGITGYSIPQSVTSHISCELREQVEVRQEGTPFRIYVSQSHYTPGESLEVMVKATGGATFAAVIMEAHLRTCDFSEHTTIGAFNGDDSLRLLNCEGIASHAVFLTKNGAQEKTFKWTAPRNITRLIEFSAMILETNGTDRDWRTVKSAAIGNISMYVKDELCPETPLLNSSSMNLGSPIYSIGFYPIVTFILMHLLTNCQAMTSLTHLL